MGSDTGVKMDDVFQQAATLPFSQVHFCYKPEVQLQAIIAIHSTELGPALGGSRLLSYASTDAALKDALRLARGMTYKSAINHLPFGGGKAVIMCPPHIHDRPALMAAYGEFVDSLGGQYITAVDSGTSPADMDIVAQHTPHVVCTSELSAGSGDPSPYTAKGVLRGIQAAVKFVFGRDQLDGLHVLIQGVGHVGYQLAKLLFAKGARISVSDINALALTRCQQEFGAQFIDPEKVIDTDCDVFSPCALGQIVNPQTIDRIKARIIAGSANNQLLTNSLGEGLRQRGIVYAPDYVINSGGMLQIGHMDDVKQLEQKIDQLYATLLSIFQQSARQQTSTNLIADQMAEQVLIDHQNDLSPRLAQGH